MRPWLASPPARRRLLVATTVIEVGVDVPEATIMVIEHAERFGLAQLHQLRGRIGRGSGASTCLLLYKAPLGETAKARLAILRETEDGFRIAEEDLRLRGEGDVLGTRQSGLPGFQIARPEVHGKYLGAARDDAALILTRDRNAFDAARRGVAPIALSVRQGRSDQVDPRGLVYSATSALRLARARAAFAVAASEASFFCASRVRLHHAGGNQQRHRVFDRDVEFDQILALYVKEKSGGRVGRARHERGDMLALRQFLHEIGARRLRQKHERPHAGRRKFHQRHLAETRTGLREQRSRKSASSSCRSVARSACG